MILWGKSLFRPPQNRVFSEKVGGNYGGEMWGGNRSFEGEILAFPPPPKFTCFGGVFPPHFGGETFPPQSGGEISVKLGFPLQNLFPPQDFWFPPHNFEDISPPSDDFGGETQIYFPPKRGGEQFVPPQNRGIPKSWGGNLSTSELCGGEIFRMGGNFWGLFPPRVGGGNVIL